MNSLHTIGGQLFDNETKYTHGVCIIGYKNTPKHSIIVNNSDVNNCREFPNDTGIDIIASKIKTLTYDDNNYLKYWNIHYNKTFQDDDTYISDKSGGGDARQLDSYHVYDGDGSFGDWFMYDPTDRAKLRHTWHSYDLPGYNVNNAPAIIANGVHNQVYTSIFRKNHMYLFNLFLDENAEDDDNKYPISSSSPFYLDSTSDDDYNKYLRGRYKLMFSDEDKRGDYKQNNDQLNPDFHGAYFKNKSVDLDGVGLGGAPIFDPVNYNTKHFIFKHDYYCFSDLFFNFGLILNRTIQLNNRYKINNNIVQSKIILQSNNINWPSWIEQIKDIMADKDCYIKKICYIPSKKNILSHLNYLIIVNTYDISLFSDKRIQIDFPGYDVISKLDGDKEGKTGNSIHDEIEFTDKIDDTIDDTIDIEDHMFYNKTNNKRFFLKKKIGKRRYKLDKFISEEDIYNLYDTNENKFYIYKPKTLGFVFTRKNGQNFTNNKPIHLPTFKEHRIAFNATKVYILANKCS